MANTQAPARSALEVTFDRGEPVPGHVKLLGWKIGDLISSRSTQILETSVRTVDLGEAAVSFNFLIPLLMAHGMHVFAREKGVDIVKRRIEQHDHRPIDANGEMAIEGQRELLSLLRPS
jgi:hypothetical protein